MARKNNLVRLRHPKTGGTYDAPASAVAFWEARGWKRPDSDSPKTTTTAQAAEKKKEA